MDVGPGLGFVLGLSSFGIVIEKWDDDSNVVYISVPETSDEIDAKGNEMAGMYLAKREKEVLSSMGVPLQLKARIREGDHWTKEKGKQAMEKMKGSLR